MTYQVILTATGAAKLAAGVVNLTHMAVGDGGGSEYQPTGAETALVNEVYRKPLSSYNVTGNKVIMQLSIPINDGGFSICEAGVFDEDGDMIYIANLATRYKPAPADGGASDLSITLVSTVSNIANLSVTVDGTAYVTHNILAIELSDKLDKTDDKATSTEAIAATDGDKFMTPETVYTAYGSADPIVLTSGSTHTQAIDESIITSAIAPMTIELAGTGDYPKSKRNRIALTIANLSNSNWTINGKASGSTNVALSIAGATNNPPVYALDTTSLPTIANGTVASNVFTASANAASAQTFDYVSSGDISSITPQMKFVPGTVLTVDPASTTGSTKFNYSASNTVQVGSKLLIDLAGAISEVTVSAGSQNSSSSTNGVIFILNTSTGRLYTSSNKLTSIDSTNLETSVLTSITNAAYFNNKYYLSGFCSGGDGIIYTSSDLVNWSIADTLVGYPRCVVMSNGSILSCAYGKNSYNLLTIRTSTDGSTFTTQTTALGVSVQGGGAQQGTIIWCGQYQNGYFLIRAGAASLYSVDGITYAVVNSGGDGGYGIGKFGSYFILNQYNASILISTNFSSWSAADGTNRGSVIGQVSVNTANTKVCIVAASGTAYYSTTGNTFSNITIGTGYTPVGSNSGQTCAVVGDTIINATTTPGRVNISNDFGLTWTSLDLSASISGTLSVASVSNISSGYQFTMTSPSIAKPNWAALSGEQLQYSVSATSTPALTTATSPTYTRSGNVITVTYAQVTGLSGTHVQLKASSLNSGDVLSQIGATLLTVGRQTINGKTNMTLAAGKVAMMVPTPNGWLST